MIVTRITIGFGIVFFGFLCWLGINGVKQASVLVVSMLALGVLIALGSNAFPPLRALPKFKRRDGVSDDAGSDADQTEKQDLEA